MNHRLIVSLAVLFFIAGCALRSSEKTHAPIAVQADQEVKQLAPFSTNQAGGLPQGWEPLIILRTKHPTQYRLVNKDDRVVVLHALAENASSGLMHKVNIDPLRQPWLHWQWKVASLVKTADNAKRATEDSPVRIILGFDGDKDAMPFTDQILFETARLISGYEFPYATLMYIWENNAPIGTVIHSSYTSRIRMIVAETGDDGMGEWRHFTRNIVEDYEKAFGEKPGRLLGVGVLTDTDNTGETAEAWYGDIHLLSERIAQTAADAAPRSPLFPGQGR